MAFPDVNDVIPPAPTCDDSNWSTLYFYSSAVQERSKEQVEQQASVEKNQQRTEMDGKGLFTE